MYFYYQIKPYSCYGLDTFFEGSTFNNTHKMLNLEPVGRLFEVLHVTAFNGKIGKKTRINKIIIFILKYMFSICQHLK